MEGTADVNVTRYHVRCVECGCRVPVCVHTARRVADGQSFMVCERCIDGLGNPSHLSL